MESLTLLTLMLMNLPFLNVCAFSERKREPFSNHSHLSDGPLNGPHCKLGPNKIFCGVSERDPWQILCVWEKKITYVAMAERLTVKD